MNTLLRVGCLFTLVITMSLTSVSVAGAAENDAEVLFEKRCSLCHPTSRPLGTSKTEEEWRQTVNRMKGLAAGKISDEEAEIIIKYLTEIKGK